MERSAIREPAEGVPKRLLDCGNIAVLQLFFRCFYRFSIFDVN